MSIAVSLTVTIDDEKRRNNGDLSEFLNSIKDEIISARTLMFSLGYNSTIAGPVLSSFFTDDVPALPNCTSLYCTDLGITKLPELPVCEDLSCNHNKLKFLPALPNCKDLYCYENQLVSLPDLPVCKDLNCRNNQLTVLPDLPSCIYLQCQTYLYLDYF